MGTLFPRLLILATGGLLEDAYHRSVGWPLDWSQKRLHAHHLFYLHHSGDIELHVGSPWELGVTVPSKSCPTCVAPVADGVALRSFLGPTLRGFLVYTCGSESIAK